MRPEIYECRFIAKQYNARVYFRYLPNGIAGCADGYTREIIINSKYKSRSIILSVFFHELVHLLCFDRGIWTNYHQSDDPEVYMKTALKAERYVDRTGEMMLYQYDKRVKFFHSYTGTNKEDREFLIKAYE